jgi:threonylcarbamoyladenosine tRNA methylthiotransferase CDKAL1
MKSVFFKTYGCSFNQLDSEIMSGRLQKEGYSIVSSDDQADVIIVNSCTVKNLSETKFFADVRTYLAQHKALVVTGCITQAEESYLQHELKGVSVIGTNDLDKVVYVVEQTLKKNPIQMVSKLGRKKENEEHRLEKEKLRLLSPKLRKNPFVEIIPINEGCLNTCSFCKTKQARGQLFSYSIENIKQSMKKALDSGVKEIYLTSQDTGCYGFDIGTNLPNLLKELLTIPGDYKIRIGMGNPNHFKKIIDDVLEIMLQDSRVYRFLHIPLQAGSNRILDEMRRMYKREEFEEIVMKAKLKVPNITLANDIIVAFGNETEEEFEETVLALQKSRSNVLNFSRFWLRPGTPAETMYSSDEFVKGDESKRRAKLLKETFMDIALENNKKWIGWEGDVLVTEQGKGTDVIGRNDYYKPIVLDNSSGSIQLGSKVRIKIIDCDWKLFYGEVLK